MLTSTAVKDLITSAFKTMIAALAVALVVVAAHHASSSTTPSTTDGPTSYATTDVGQIGEPTSR